MEECCPACLAGAPDVAAPASSRVDRRRGVIRGVKVLAAKSRNGRVYTQECLKRAAPLYEGVSVRIDHPDGDDADRKADGVLGQLRKVRLGPGGLYADLEYLQSHPMSERLCEAAERMPKAYGLSHNVSDWKGHYEGGTYVVDEILEVESVDLVADPATTQGLFESKKPGKMKGAAMKRQRLAAWLREQAAPVRRAFRRLIEAGAASGSTLLAGGNDPEGDIKAAFRAAVNAVLDDGQADMKTKLGRMKEIMAAEEKLMQSGAVTPSVADDDLPDGNSPGTAGDAGDELTEEDAGDMGDDAGMGDDDGMADDGMGDDDGLTEDHLDDEEAELGDDDLDDLLADDEENLEEEYDDEDEEEVRESVRPAGVRALQRENLELRRELEVRRLCEAERVQPSPALLKALTRLDDEGERRELLRENLRRPARAYRPEDESFADSITVREEA